MFSYMKMPLSKAFAVSFIGIVTVIIILAIIALLIICISKVIRAFEEKVSSSYSHVTSAPADTPAPQGIVQGEVELIGTDEKTAAVIMAIVSKKSGVPLNRLSFKSIRLMENEKKGEENK